MGIAAPLRDDPCGRIDMARLGTAAAAALLIIMALARGMQAEVSVAITYLRQEIDHPPTLSNLDPIPADLGLAGAELAIADNATTGKFLDHSYKLTLISVPPEGALLDEARRALAASDLVLLEADAAAQLAIADLPEAAGKLLLNTSSGAARLRSDDCRANLLHTLPEDAARSDALMQFLLAKNWVKLVLITGPNPADAAFAEALRQSAQKFGMGFLAEKTWTFDTDLRESTFQEIPRFLQDFPDHDAVIIADETDDFGRYVADNQWLPRIVAGSDGLMPLAWSPTIESWGAVQLQDRFRKQAGRPMQSRDYAAWLAVRAIGEAVTRSGRADAPSLRAYMLSDAFTLDGFKGRGLSFRRWNGQLRQPIALANSRALVATAPLEGFLHQRNEMDSLGLDQPESHCTVFGE
jgi:ABC transporter substrate binding protein (PQQ-dependent alcohol dehydrogenase system)